MEKWKIFPHSEWTTSSIFFCLKNVCFMEGLLLGTLLKKHALFQLVKDQKQQKLEIQQLKQQQQQYAYHQPYYGNNYDEVWYSLIRKYNKIKACCPKCASFMDLKLCKYVHYIWTLNYWDFSILFCIVKNIILLYIWWTK